MSHVHPRKICIESHSVKGTAPPALIKLLLVVLAGTLGLSGQSTDSTTLKRLKEFVDQIKVVDIHEHIGLNTSSLMGSRYENIGRMFSTSDVNFYSILSSDYLPADLISAGSPPIPLDWVLNSELQRLWQRHGKYLDLTRNTSYYSQLIDSFKILYDFREPYFTENNIAQLSKMIARNYEDKNRWVAKAFEKAGFDVMLVDQSWDQFKTGTDFPRFVPLMRIDQYLMAIGNREEYEKPGANPRNNPFLQAKKEGFEIRTLDYYLAFADRWFQIFSKKAAGAKCRMAYIRSLDFEDFPLDRARNLFAKPSSSLTPAEKKNLEDFMFHWSVQKLAKYDLPLQIHTGYTAGNRARLDNGQPLKLLNVLMKYPNEKFCLLHGAYPWYHELGALAKSFPNVYVDLVWLPQLSRHAAVEALQEWLDSVPYNKITWGGDEKNIDSAAGSLELGRSVVAQVLAERVDKGLMTEELARDVAVKIFRDNAIEIYKLKTKTHLGLD